MIMDEVLAVGDMAFQKKCLVKMREAANKEGRTILYVSHSMNTIRQLCDRCIVMDKGKMVFDGDVEEAIQIYMNSNSNDFTFIDFSKKPDVAWLKDPALRLRFIELVGKESNIYYKNEPLRLNIQWTMERTVSELCLRIEVYSREEIPQATFFLFNCFDGRKGNTITTTIELDVSNLADARYQLKFIFFEKDKYGNNVDVGFGRDVYFEKTDFETEEKLIWNYRAWGYVKMPTPKVMYIERG